MAAGNLATPCEPQQVSILGISGSLRKASYNTALLRAVAQYIPDNVNFHFADISKLPLYNEDLKAEGQEPEIALQWRRQVQNADAILICTCQYNFSISAALKNAIDWPSVGVDNAWDGKPIAIMAAGGGGGGNLALINLQTILFGLSAHVLPKPRICLKIAEEPSHFEFIDDLPQLKADSSWQRKIRGVAELLVKAAIEQGDQQRLGQGLQQGLPIKTPPVIML